LISNAADHELAIDDLERAAKLYQQIRIEEGLCNGTLKVTESSDAQTYTSYVAVCNSSENDKLLMLPWNPSQPSSSYSAFLETASGLVNFSKRKIKKYLISDPLGLFLHG